MIDKKTDSIYQLIKYMGKKCNKKCENGMSKSMMRVRCNTMHDDDELIRKVFSNNSGKRRRKLVKVYGSY